jgi:maltooligosyltrehalose trehalohydrolase
MQGAYVVGMKLGAIVEPGGTRFCIWAPTPRRIELEILSPRAQRIPLDVDEDGYAELLLEGVGAGARYFFLLDGERRRPDPASRSQPEGVHGASEVVDPSRFVWQHAFRGYEMSEYILYELHIGTFTREGTFDAGARELPRLVDLGVNAVEIMPVASFPGRRNWGYDGVAWYAPQVSYGGPEGLRRFVDACHAQGLAAVLDVVYNHFGPEGNYLREFGPYFTERWKTPWGPALVFDGPHALPVRRHVLDHARSMVNEFHLDGLRLDAVHAIYDESACSIIEEVCELVHHEASQAGRKVMVIAESDLGQARVVEPPDAGGWGCDSMWADDLHHALHVALTGEREGIYRDFSPNDLEPALEEGVVYTGQRSDFRGRPFGTPVKHRSGENLVVCSQNHDQVGNRARGERLAHLAPGCEYAAAAVALLAPAIPLLFMGEEHADPAPFLYFTDFADPEIARGVSEGRRSEVLGQGVDPQIEEAFLRSRIDLSLADRGRHGAVRQFYRALLKLRRKRLSLRRPDRTRSEAHVDHPALVLRRFGDCEESVLFVALGPHSVRLTGRAPRSGEWRTLLDASDPLYDGPAGARWAVRDGVPEAELPGFGVLLLGADWE